MNEIENILIYFDLNTEEKHQDINVEILRDYIFKLDIEEYSNLELAHYLTKGGSISCLSAQKNRLYISFTRFSREDILFQHGVLQAPDFPNSNEEIIFADDQVVRTTVSNTVTKDYGFEVLSYFLSHAKFPSDSIWLGQMDLMIDKNDKE